MWPFNRRAPRAETTPLAAETKSLSDPTAELIALFTGGGVVGTISNAQALSVPAVAASVRLIAESVATLDARVKRTVEDATVDATDHPAWALLQGSVNDWTSFYELCRDLVADALVSDVGGIGWVNRVGGKPYEVIRYQPGNFTVEYSARGTGEPTYRLNGKKVKREDIIHVRGLFSRCPLSLAKDAIAAAHVMGGYAAKLFANGAVPGGVIEIPSDLAPEQVSKIREAWIATYGGAENAGKPAVLFDGATWKQSTLNSTDAQFLENRKFQNLEIARAFRVPPGMIFEMDRQTWSNGEQQGKEFLSYTLEPWLRAVETALERGLLTKEDREAGYSIVFDRDDLTRADFAARMTAYSTAISARIYNPNECRAYEGLAPYDGGNVFTNPHITVKPEAEPSDKPEQVAEPITEQGEDDDKKAA